jgi:hypothetical protein
VRVPSKYSNLYQSSVSNPRSLIRLTSLICRESLRRNILARTLVIWIKP